MTKIIACLMAMFFLSSCASSSDQIYLLRANCRISANIQKDAEGNKMGMVFENKSDKSVHLQNPECLNQNVIITVRKSSGEEAVQQFPVESETCGASVVLKPGESRTFVVPYTLESLYGLKEPGKYTVYFEYIGGFYEENGAVYGEQILKSPIEDFALK